MFKGISPIKMDLISPLKPIDGNIISSYATNGLPNGAVSIVSLSSELSSTVALNKTIDNLLISNLMAQKLDQHHSSNLLGDYSNTYALPLISGRHKDLKTISPETLASLMNGDYSESINCFTVIDCRYPYEFDGGHIDGSKNIFYREEVNKYFFGTDRPTLITDRHLILNTIRNNGKQSSTNSIQQNRMHQLNAIREDLIVTNDENLIKVELDSKSEDDENSAPKSVDLTAKSEMADKSQRHAIIFHCEFSSERGPTL